MRSPFKANLLQLFSNAVDGDEGVQRFRSGTIEIISTGGIRREVSTRNKK